MRTVLVIGAGFCGTMVAVHLLRRPPPGPLRILLLNRSGVMARGVAYGTRSEGHVLNVPAGRMSAFPDDAADFVRYVQRFDRRYTASSFVPRRLYGQYLESLLTRAAREAPAGCSFRSMVGEAISLRPSAAGAMVELDQGETVSVDRVVLALGNFSPAHPRVERDSAEFFRSPRYVRDAWSADALRVIPLEEPVLLVGTGLTMLDVLLDLRARGHRGVIFALSRRGLLPLPHRELGSAPDYASLMTDDLPGPATIRNYLRAVRWKVHEAQRHGADWRDAIGALRARTPALWRVLTIAERKRFLRHVRPFWDVHRHRCAPELAEALQAERAAGSLRIIAGRLLRLTESTDHVAVTYRCRSTGRERSIAVAAVVNCTGPENDTRSLREPLLRHLRDRGAIEPDELGLGLQVADDYSLIDRNGRASSTLFYVGPFLRARDWEATAVPELRVHASACAESVRQSLIDAPGIPPGSLDFA